MRFNLMMKVAGLVLGLFVFKCNISGPSSEIDGVWALCITTAGSTDVKNVYTFSGNGTSLLIEYFGYSSADGSCSTGQIPGGGGNATGAVGAKIQSTIGVGGPSVTATEYDMKVGGVTYYSLYYIDKTVSPNLLHLGKSSGGTDNGSSPANRYTIVDTSCLIRQ